MVTLIATGQAGPRIVEAGPCPEPPPGVTAAVSAHWRRHRRNRPEAFDGPVLSAVSVTPGEIVVCASRYRFWVAQHAGIVDLGLRPLAVSGVLRCTDGFLLCRRAAGVTQDAGCWELAPSGGITPETRSVTGRLSAPAQLRLEATEELGLRPDQIGELTAVAIATDGADRGVDIVLSAGVRLDGTGVVAMWERRGTVEYDDLAIVPAQSLPDFCADRPMSPLSVQLIGELGLDDPVGALTTGLEPA